LRLRAGAAAPSALAGTPADAPLETIPEVVRGYAGALRVPDAALRAALAASSGSSDDRANLKAHGADGFRAVVAMLRGGVDPADYGRLFATVWTPSMAGEEQALIDVAESADRVRASKALMALGFCDTTRTREYLVWKLRGDGDGRFVHACSGALGRLREPSALPELARAIRNGRAPAAERATALLAIADIGGAEAKSILVDYVREPGTDGVAAGFAALQRVDREAAREEALAILAGQRLLSTGEREALLGYAGKR